MSDLSREADDLVAAGMAILLAQPHEERLSFVHASGWPHGAVVRALKERSFAVLDSNSALALQLAELSIQVAAGAHDESVRALAERGMAQALHAAEQYAGALEHYDAAGAAFARCGDLEEAARTLIGKVGALMYLGRYDQALDTAHAARAGLLAHGDLRRAARLDVNHGNILHRLDRPTEALALYEKAREVLVRYGSALEVALVDLDRGNVLSGLNRFDEALAAYALAEATYRASGQDADLAQTAYNQAYLHFLRGQYSRALTDLGRVRVLFTDLGDLTHLALCDLDEAEVLLALNRIGDAAELAGRAAASFDGLGMRYEAAKARVFRCVAALEAGDAQSAHALLAEASALFSSEGNLLWIATVELLFAEFAVRDHSGDLALMHCNQAMELLAPLPLTTRMGHARVLRGRALQLLGNQTAARASAQAACLDAQSLNDHVLSYQACHLLGRLQEHAGDLDAAAASFTQAMDAVDWLRGGISRDDLRISFVGDKVALYEDAVRTYLRLDRAVDAFEQVERARARAMVDLLAAGPPITLQAADNDVALATRVEELRAVLAGLYNRLQSSDEGHSRNLEGHEALLTRMRRNEAEMTAALAQLQVRHADFVALGTVSTVRLEQVRQRLATSDALLEYYILDDEVLAFVITRNEIRVHGPLLTRVEVEEWVERWRFHLAQFRYGSAFVQRHSAHLLTTALDLLGSLHRRLIAPLAQDLAGHSLVIVPHGPLHHVPFQALHDGCAYLIEQHEISFAPSASALVLQRVKRRAGGRAVIVGVPTPSLPHITEEVAAVAACHNQPVVLLGADATRARFVSATVGCRSIHLATHAVFRADNPLFSAVQLADGWLTVSDVYNLDLRADLVVLSACETGASAVLHGDELVGLLRGFLFAGARSLVASLWAANDAATASLMTTFHRAIGAGASARLALRLAQRQAMQDNPHPYYWAPFMVYGLANEETSATQSI